MNNSKRIFLVFMTLIVCFCCVCAYKHQDQPSSTAEESPTQETEVVYVTFDLVVEETMEVTEEPEAPTAEELFWQKCREQYPVATDIWLIMKSYGWTDAACAGIMGNIMREVGGNTLAHINPNAYSSSGAYFGLCQWSNYYYADIHPTDVWTPTIQEQLDYLRYTIINQRSLRHNYGFDEDYLNSAIGYKEVARVFCNGYERPQEGSAARENNAEIAWKYFVLGEDI